MFGCLDVRIWCKAGRMGCRFAKSVKDLIYEMCVREGGRKDL